MSPRDVPVRFTRLKLMARSPAHYRYGLDVAEDKPAYGFGRAVHSMVLGGEDVIHYPGRRAGKAWEQFQADHEGCEILTVKDYGRARRCADSVLGCSRALDVLGGRHEVDVQWKNELRGRSCSSRIDVLGSDYITELKTGMSAQPDQFARAALRMHYHGQVSWYQDAAAWMKLRTPYGFIVAVESNPPFPVTVMRVTPRAIEQGRMLTRLWLERLIACEDADAWPGYCESIVDLDIPDEEQELTFGEEGEEAAG